MGVDPKVVKQTAQMIHKFKRELTKLIGKPLFAMDREEVLAAVGREIQRNLEILFKQRGQQSVGISVDVDPNDKSRAIITLTALDEYGERTLKRYIEMQKELNA